MNLYWVWNHNIKTEKNSSRFIYTNESDIVSYRLLCAIYIEWRKRSKENIAFAQCKWTLHLWTTRQLVSNRDDLIVPSSTRQAPAKFCTIDEHRKENNRLKYLHNKKNQNTSSRKFYGQWCQKITLLLVKVRVVLCNSLNLLSTWT